MKQFSILILVLLVLLAALPALAQQGGSFDLTWSTVDGGGGASSGGDYTLQGTSGQHDAGVLTGGGFTLAGGFWGGWPGSQAQTHAIYLPLVIR